MVFWEEMKVKVIEKVRTVVRVGVRERSKSLYRVDSRMKVERVFLNEGSKLNPGKKR
jgi:hypothetical protein